MITITSCSHEIYRINEGARMSMYLRQYIDHYFDQPKNINFLIKAFDELDFTDEVHQDFSEQYKLLKKYSDKIILQNTDSTTMLYFKYIDTSHIIGGVGANVEYDCFRKYQLMYGYFNKGGYLVTKEERTNELKKSVIEIYKQYESFELSDSCTMLKYKYIILQYTDNDKLINFDTKELIDYNNSRFYGNIMTALKCFSNKYNLSKIIMPCLIPKNVNLTNNE
jgi:hypothetical protein